jgi:transposase
VNRRRDRAKILLWDRTGYRLLYKRFEEGTFKVPVSSDPSVEVTSAELSLIIEGIDLSTARRRKRYSRIA